MDWAKAIERNGQALIAIVSALFALLGLPGAAVGRIPRRLHSEVLRVLRPAESAARRLIVMAARGLVVTLAPPRLPPAGRVRRPGAAPGVSFQLFDPRKRFAITRRRPGPRVLPRVYVIGPDPRVAALWPAPRPAAVPAPPPDGRVESGRLCRRLAALKLALDDIPRQARRLARLTARREKVPRLQGQAALRPGPAPGHRARPVHEVDFVLAECHALAREALWSNTS